MRKSILAGGMLISVLGASASAATPDKFEVHSAADLVAICSTVPNDNISAAAIGFCHGYVVGVYRTLEEVQEARPAKPFFCVTQNPTSRTEAINAYVAWTTARPAQLSKLPMESIADYLSQTYPCPAATPSATSSSRRRAQ